MDYEEDLKNIVEMKKLSEYYKNKNAILGGLIGLRKLGTVIEKSCDDIFNILNFLQPVWDDIPVTPKQPIIKKSGDTWVAEWDGVDYLYVGVPVSYSVKSFTLKDLLREIDNKEWKPISEIEITDELSKLRPIIIYDSKVILYGVVKDDCHSYLGIEVGAVKSALFNKRFYRLATVKDLQES